MSSHLSSHLLRSDLDPVLGGYVLVMVALAAGLAAVRRQARSGRGDWEMPRAAGRHARGWRALIWHVTADAAGGYLLLMAVVIGYYYGVARVGSHFLASAFSGNALLVGITLPVYAAATWLSERRLARRGRPGRRHDR